MKPTILDRAIATIAPRTAVKRMMARAAYERINQFSYDAAQMTRLRNKSMTTPTGPESSRYQSDRYRIITQVRDLDENEPLVHSILNLIPNYVCGKLSYTAQTGDLAVDDRYEAYVQEWMANCDITGRRHFAQLMQLAVRSERRDGDMGFIVVDDDNTFKLQAIEADCIGTPYQTFVSPEKVGGINIDPTNGRPISYDIYSRGIETNVYTLAQVVPAEAFLHLCDPKRIDQYRPVSCFAASVNTIQDLHETLEAERMACKMLACITGTIHTEFGEALDTPGDIFQNTVQDPNGVARTNNIQTFEAGKFYHLGVNEKAQAFQNDRPSPAFQGLTEMMIRFISMSVNYPYAFLYNMGNLTGPAIRMEVVKADRETQRLQSNLENQILRPIIYRVLAKGIENGDIPQSKNWKFHKWGFPARPTIDVGRESAAAQAEIDKGMRTLADWYSEQGEDYIEQMEQRTKEKKFQQDLDQRFGITSQQAEQAPRF